MPDPVSVAGATAVWDRWIQTPRRYLVALGLLALAAAAGPASWWDALGIGKLRGRGVPLLIVAAVLLLLFPAADAAWEVLHWPDVEASLKDLLARPEVQVILDEFVEYQERRGGSFF